MSGRCLTGKGDPAGDGCHSCRMDSGGQKERKGIFSFFPARSSCSPDAGEGTIFSGCGFFVAGVCHDATEGASFVRAQGVAIVQTGVNGYFIDRVCTFPAGGFFGMERCGSRD